MEESEEFRGYWKVDALYPEYFFEYEELIGPWRILAPDKLLDFLAFSEERGYHPVFETDPLHMLEAVEHLHDDPNVVLHSTMENTTYGFLPWQVVGYNKLIRDESIKMGYFVWTVGSGKTAMIAAAIQYHRSWGHPFDLAFVTVKSHNKIDTQRKLKAFADIDAIIIDGSKKKRYEIYEDIATRLSEGKPLVAITNYEKFREDQDAIFALFKGLDMLFFWDEAPRKLTNRATKLYRACKRALYIKFTSKPRPRWQRHWVLSATPIENSPEDVFSVTNLFWPRLLGTAADFHNQYVLTYNFFSGKPESWQNLDHLTAKISFMTHRVSRDDPEIVEMFPERIPMPHVIDWDPHHRELYNKLTKKASDLFDEEESNQNILSIIQIMQMLCDAPSMIKESAKNRERFNKMMEGVLEDQSGPVGSEIAFQMVQKLGPESFSDRGHTKLAMWKEIITEKHPADKIVTYSTWADYIFPVWEYWLNQWGISYVIYDGPRKQEALDRFREEPDIRVFLSGDSGSDSIDIVESRVGVNYNMPWKWTTLEQRIGRRDRANSGFKSIYTYDLMMANSIDERKKAICERKKGYHETVYDGQVKTMDSAKITRADLYYILTGEDLTALT